MRGGRGHPVARRRVARENEASSEKASSADTTEIDVFEVSSKHAGTSGARSSRERGNTIRRFDTWLTLRVSVLGIRESTRAYRGLVFRETASFVPPPARDASGYSRREALRRDGLGRAAVRSEAHRTKAALQSDSFSRRERHVGHRRERRVLRRGARFFAEVSVLRRLFVLAEVALAGLVLRRRTRGMAKRGEKVRTSRANDGGRRGGGARRKKKEHGDGFARFSRLARRYER